MTKHHEILRMILYEYPCNERVRNLLRLEHLFDRLFFFADQQDPRQHQIAVATLFDLLDICDRSDLRSAIMQDLDRQRANLTALKLHPDVDQARLVQMLQDIQRIASELSTQGRIAQPLRDNEWLAALRGRLAVPGGASQVDTPAYYDWQIQPADVRAEDLRRWIQPFLTLHHSIALMLRSLRDAGDVVDVTACQGAYQEMLSGKTFQLLRVWVDPNKRVFPEMSANKYMIWVRFSTQARECKPQPVTQDIPFQLARCNL